MVYCDQFVDFAQSLHPKIKTCPTHPHKPFHKDWSVLGSLQFLFKIILIKNIIEHSETIFCPPPPPPPLVLNHHAQPIII